MIERKKTWGEDRVLYVDESAEMRLIPTSWTDVLEEDPFTIVSNGRSAFRFDDLKELSRLMKSIKEAGQSVN